MGPNTRSLDSQSLLAFVEQLRELGWIEGRTVAIEYRWAEGRTGSSPRWWPSSSGGSLSDRWELGQLVGLHRQPPR
jgi:hypothetical protein